MLPMDTQNRMVPRETGPFSSHPPARTKSSRNSLMWATFLPVFSVNASIKLSRGPAPQSLAMYSPIPKPLMTSPAANIIIAAAVEVRCFKKRQHQVTIYKYPYNPIIIDQVPIDKPN